MRMKFFERTFLITFILFLVFLNIGIFALAMYTYQNNIEAAESVCIAEINSIIDAFESDYAYAGASSAKILQTAYGKFYSEKDIKLKFMSDGETTYSAIPEGLSVPDEGKMSGGKVDGKRYIIISRFVCDGEQTLVYAKDVSYLDIEFKHLCIVFVFGSFVASLLLGAVLYFILRKLYLPLVKLRTVTEEIANGDFDVRADDKGDDEVSALAKDFNVMADKVSRQILELKDTADQKQRMLDNLAHEMRTPLTAIHGYAEYICSARIPEEERVDAAKFIMSESMRLKDISEVLLDSAYIRENGINVGSVSLGVIVKKACARLEITAKERGVDITSETDECIINGDAVLLEILVTNLAENALKACKNGGRVTVGTCEKDGIKCLCVSDNGIGMTAEQLAHITEPFYRTDTSRSRAEGGTGLGLALCKRIVLAHGGELIFESKENKGTKVIVEFTRPLQVTDNSITTS